MKDLIKRLLRHSGYEVTRLDSRIEVDCAWGPNVLLFALDELAARDPAKRLNVVQIGANDGSDQDPLQSFLLDRNCEAILIEPMDQPFAALSENTAARTTCTPFRPRSASATKRWTCTTSSTARASRP